jgi:hypothetical protein
MKMQLAAGLLAGSLAMSGCASNGQFDPSLFNEDIATAIAAVQAATRAACGVVPVASQIAQIIAAQDPALATASAIAGVVCAAVAVQAPTTPPAPHFAAVPSVTITVNGQPFVIQYTVRHGGRHHG